ncbi:MAG TPA: GNAT family N-acetyltransferase [Patescibacteria group bacterium]|nr:GNAT family N-acetyltransferase [Patescibacteria group bacterium]
MNLLEEVIESERLKLVPTSEEYAQDIYKEFTREITEYMYPKSADDVSETLEFIKFSRDKMETGEQLQVVILNKNTGEFLGHGGINHLDSGTPELGIWIKRDAHGNKYGLEAIHALKNWIDRNLSYRYIFYPVDNRNIASRKIAESLGGIIEDEYKKTNMQGNILDMVEYRIYPK